MKALVFITLTALAACMGAQAQGLEEAQQQIKLAWEAHTSMRCKVFVEAEPSVGHNRVGMRGEGTTQALRTDGLDRYKSLVKLNLMSPMEATMTVETVFDGTSLHISNDTMGRRQTRETTPGLFRGAIPPGGGPLLEALAAELKLERLPDATLEGTEAFVLEGRARRGEELPGPVMRSRAFVAKETGALLRLELYESAESLAVRITHSEFEWDLEMDPAIFAPTDDNATPPPLEEEEPAEAAAAP